MKLKQVLVASAMLALGFTAQASVTLTFDREIDIKLVNGQEVDVGFMGNRELTLDNGTSQVFYRVSAIVHESGVRKKFNSHWQVVLFDAYDTSLEMSVPVRLDTVRHGINYNVQPTIELTKNGQAFPHEHDYFEAEGFNVFTDPEDELARYNATGGAAVYIPSGQVEERILTPTTAAVQAAAPVAVQASAPVTTSAPVSGDNAMILIQADFLRLSEVQKRMFLDWAKQQ
ncbi:DUF2057 family protein [Thaumasiovibrio subtropicus]|uniref:DUF2057 family protein n=1 Tax=Thaumasiovibrio subtropicus TaxID=1891207 RepID=UPI000B34BE91|nr:DUF2057 family protein [Thaumasiovibrio subtropicus]